MDYNEFMLKVRRLRLQNKLSQAHLAEELGCTRVTYAKYEEGKAEISLSKAVKVANLFGCSLDALLSV